MARRRKKKLPQEPFEAAIRDMAHDGRGVAEVGGKTVFIDGALPGERVMFCYSNRRSKYDEGVVEKVLESSPERVQPACPHFSICGGCSLQHLSAQAQIRLKQAMLESQFRKLGSVTPETMMEPLTGPVWGYRRKARLGVKYVIKKEKVLVGFREKRAPYLAELESCRVLHPSVGEHLTDLADLVASLESYNRIAQIEVAVDDEKTALVFRNLRPLSGPDLAKLKQYAQTSGIQILLQPEGPESITPLWPEQIELSYRLEQFDVRFRFEPTDFTQVNRDINLKMVPLALELLELTPEDRVLDLFCGLGNFTLPIARQVKEVVGVEGEASLVKRAQMNAQENGITNAHFHVADLTADLAGAPWWAGGFDKVLLDPPRSGAEETLAHIAKLGVKCIVYVSCGPATLARDAGILVNQFGYRLVKAGVMDMFPHTAHVESIALFIKK